MSDLKLPLTVNDIKELVPHRYPFLFVDRVIDFKLNDYIIGIKNVTANEPYFTGHFPNSPIMPGVIQIEALAQMGVLYAKLCKPEARTSLIVLAGVDNVKFKRQVVPGDVLRLEMGNCRSRLGHWKMEGKAFVDEDLTCCATFQAVEIPGADLR
ncbi:MAG: 3-hydroxyacyl-ACP dehydratase FabZ [bacterium]|nr:3-hydroxyacyl-ACP dehydratase FabZ [bacterium]